MLRATQDMSHENHLSWNDHCPSSVQIHSLLLSLLICLLFPKMDAIYSWPTYWIERLNTEVRFVMNLYAWHGIIHVDQNKRPIFPSIHLYGIPPSAHFQKCSKFSILFFKFCILSEGHHEIFNTFCKSDDSFSVVVHENYYCRLIVNFFFFSAQFYHTVGSSPLFTDLKLKINHSLHSYYIFS